MTFDVRTRIDGEADRREPGAVRDALADALAGTTDLLRPALHLGRHPLTITVDDDTWHVTCDDGPPVLRAGAAGDGLRLRLTADQLADLWSDQATPMTWFSGGSLELDGRLEHLLDWWVLLRGAIDGRAPHVAGAIDLTEIDLTRSFTLDDADDDIAAALATAGFVRIRGVYTEDEMAAVSADMDAAASTYEKGDGHSWWARTSDGADRLVRMQGADAVCPSIGRLVEDERLARIGALARSGHEWGTRTGNRIEALFKPIGVVEGISDVPWHKDCSLGRHSYECCSLTVGISVSGAGPTSGQLRVVAGSHRALMWPALLRRDNDLPIVDLPTETGDVTVHLSCTLHMAQPPVDRERRVLYTGFRLPPANREATRAARERLGRIREAAPVTVSQPASPVSRS
ncbi:MAG TPA: phytanoyl-CoA dioxygenase family protein [Iamia sp.]